MSNVQKRSLYWMIAAVIYFIVPLDLDFVPPIGYIDDAIFLWWAYKNHKNQHPIGGAGIGRHFPQSNDGDVIIATIVDEPEWTPPRYIPRQRMPIEKPGFLAGLWKMLLRLLNGGAQ